MAVFYDARELAKLMKERADTHQGQQDVATRIIGIKAVNVSLKHMDRLIYQNPIPLNKHGRPKWRWTYMLRDNERVAYREGRDGLVAVLRNDTRYAEFRHEMGKPGRRNTNRRAHWRDAARKELRQMAVEERREAHQKALGRVVTKIF